MGAGKLRHRLGGRVGGWGNLLFVGLAGLLAFGGFAVLFELGGHGSAAASSGAGRGSGPAVPTFAPVHDDVLPREVGLPAASPLAYSVPVRLDFDEAAIHADVFAVGLGLGPTGAASPQPGEDREADWDALGPTPGELGASVVDVHVGAPGTSARRVNAALQGELKPGQTIRVTRADHSIAVFTVDAVEQMRGSTAASLAHAESTPYASLRLVAYTGSYLQLKRGYGQDTVVFAHLSAWRSTSPTGRAD